MRLALGQSRLQVQRKRIKFLFLYHLLLLTRIKNIYPTTTKVLGSVANLVNDPHGQVSAVRLPS
jgi:hypothetical protein